MEAFAAMMLSPPGALTPGGAFLLLTLHGVVGFAAAALCTILVRKRIEMRRRRWQFFALAASLILFIPGLGIIGMLVVVHAMRNPIHAEDDNHESYALPELPYTPGKHRTALGSIRDLLHFAEDLGSKHDLVAATRSMPDREAVPLLRLLLLDADDEIRLTAYVSIDQKESSLTRRINRFSRRVRAMHQAEPAVRARINLRLAQWNWELVYVGLAERDLRDHALAQARRHAEAALEDVDSVEVRLLLGKILVAQGEASAGAHHLHEARDRGATLEQTLPYLAETAFLERDFDGVQRYLQDLPLSRRYPALNELRMFWG